MENQNQNRSGIAVDDDNGKGPMSSSLGVAQAPDEYNPDSLSLDPEVVHAAALSDAGQIASARGRNLFSMLTKRADLILAILLVVTVAGFLVNSSTNNSNKEKNQVAVNDAANKYETQEIPLSGFVVTGQGVNLDSSIVAINGGLLVNGELVITPSLQPSSPKTGQLYFDEVSNLLAYYNGSGFVTLGADKEQEVVQSLGGLTGQVGLAGGLGIVNNQLINSGVLSLGGSNGTIVLGNGLAMSANTLQNTGVLNITAGTPNVTITDNGGGNISVSVAGAGTGTVSSTGGTNGFIPVFTTSQNIEDSIVSQSGANITVGGSLGVTGALTLGSALTVANGGTGAASLTANGVIVGNGAGALSSVAAGGAGLCLLSTVGAPAWGACPGGGGVTSLNSLTGALSIANASGAGSVVTINDASTAAKGIAQFNATNFSASAGTINTIQNINSGATPTFAGLNTNNITPSGAFTVGAGGQTALLQGSTVTVTSNSGGDIVLNSAGQIRLNGFNCTTFTNGGTLTTDASGNLACSNDDGGAGGGVTSLNALSGTLTLAGTAGQITVNDNGSNTITLSLNAAVTLQGNTFNGANQLVQLNASSQLPAVSGALLTNLNASALATGTVPSSVVSGSYTGITGVGTVTVGTWQGTALADGFVADNLTISSSGSVDWTALTNYPTGCGAGQAVTAVGDTLTCASFAAGSGSGSYINNTTSLQTSANLNIQSGVTTNVTANFRALTSQTADIIRVRNATDTVTVFAVAPSGAVTATSFSGDGSALTALNGSNITTGTVANARLVNSGALTVTAGTGLSGGGSVALGGSTTLNLADTAVTLGSYGSASQVATFTVDQQGRLTAAGSTSIAIAGTQITSGTINDARLSANVTVQGNTFNGANQLVQLNASTELPAVSGVNLTALNATQLTSGTVPSARVSGSYSGITGVGTIGAGVWQGTAVADGFVADNLTISSSGSVDWTALTNYPTGCSAGQAVTAVGDTLTCAPFASASGSGSYINNTTTLQTSANFNVQSGVTTDVTANFRALTSQTADIIRIRNAADTVTVFAVNPAGDVAATSFTGNGSGLTALNGSNISTGTVANARLVNSGALTVTAGTGLSGGGSVALGSSTTLNLADTAVTPNSYGSASSVATFTVDQQGRLTAAGSTSIAIAGTQITSGTINDARLSANVTVQGNTFNGANQLVQLNASTELPAVSGVNLTALNATQLTSGTVPAARVSGSYTGITGVGTIGAGVWQGTAVADTYVADNLTISSSGSVDWTALTSYPTGCSAGNAVTAVGDTLTCAPFASASGSGSYINNTTTLQTSASFNVQSGNTTDVTANFQALASQTADIIRVRNSADTVTVFAVNPAGDVTATSFTGNGSGLTALNGSNISTGTVANARLVNSGALTVTAGTGLTGGGSVALGGSTTINLGDTAVTLGSYGSASQVATFTVDQQGRLTAAANTSIAIAGTQITSGTINDARLSANVTVQGNTFNGANQLVQLNASTELPAVSGVNLTALNATQLTSGTVPSARISGSYTGITGVGTIATGTWQATAVAINYGGTGANTSQGAINAISQLTTEGDLLYHNGTNSNRLARGSNGECLVSTATSIQWGSCSGSAGITGTGVSGRVTFFNGASTVTSDADLLFDGTTLTANTLSVTNNATVAGTLAVQGASLTLGEAGPAGTNGSLVFNNDTNANTVTIQSGVTGTSYALTLPTDVGGANQCLKAQDGTGTLFWDDCEGGTGGTSGVSSVNTLDGALVVQGTAGHITVNDNGTDTITLDVGANVTLQGNTFNGANQLVQLNASTELPAVSGVNLTALNATQLTSGTVPSARVSGSYTGITGVGTIGAGTWQGTAVADTYVADNLTISSSGSVDWTALTAYPTGCSAGNAVTAVGDTLTCAAFAAASGSTNYINNDTALQTNANFNIQTAATTSVTANFQALASQTADVIRVRNSADTVTVFAVNPAGDVTATSFTGNGSGLTALNGSNISTGTVANARLVNSGALTVTAGTGLTGGGSVALGSSTTLNLADTAVTPGSYGSASSVATFTVDQQGRLTAAGSTSIAIAGTQITSGTINDARLSANVTVQGNTFNGANQLVQLNASTELPAVSGVNLTALNATQLTSGTVPSARVSGSYTGITGVGTIGAGVWQGTAVADTYVADNLTISSSGTVDWTALTAYPTGCSAGNAVTAVGDTLTCAPFAAASGSGSYINNTTTLQTSANFNVQSGNTTDVTANFQALASQTADIIRVRNSADTVTVFAVAPSGAVTATSFTGDGSGLTALNATQLTSGTVASARISGSYTGITGVGTITVGTWNGTAVADTYVADNLTISSGGSVDWTALTNYPTGCSAGNAVTAVGDTLTCAAFAPASGSSSYINNTTTLQTSANFNVQSGNTTDVTANFRALASQTADIIRVRNSADTVTVFAVNPAGDVTATSFTGDGSALTALNATQLTSGTVASARISGSYTGITGVGTIGTGTWQGTAVADTYVADNLTISSSGTVDWTALNNYPTGCSAGNAVTAVGDTLTCAAFAASSGSGSYINNTTTLQTSANFNIQTAATTSVTANFQALASQTADVIRVRNSADTVTVFSVNPAGDVTATSFTGNGSGLTALNGSNISTGTVANARLVNSGALTVTAGTGLSGGGSVALGGSTTLNLADTLVTPGSYGSASSVATFTVDQQGRLTAAASTSIAIAGTQITSGTINDARLSTNVTVQGNTFNGANQLVQLNASTELPAVSGVNLTALNATQLTSGTVPSARVSGSYSGITGVGTIGAGVWQGTAVADTYVADNLTISSSGSVDWTALTSYPTGCGAGQAVTAVGDTLTCASFAPASGSTSYINNTTTLQTSANFNMQSGATTDVTANFRALGSQTADIIRVRNSADTVTVFSVNPAGDVAATSFTGDGSGLTALNGSNISTGTVANARLVNSGALTVTAGTGLSGGGSVALGGSTSLSVSYGSASGTAVQGNTTLTCPSGTGNLTGGGTVITLGTGGTCGAIDTVASPTFTGNVTIQGTTGLTFNTGAGGDITFANSEKIDNDTNGTINLSANSGAITLLLTGTAASINNSAGTLSLNSASTIELLDATNLSGNFLQSGATTFGTGTGAVSLNGDTTVAAGKNLSLATGSGVLYFDTDGEVYIGESGSADTDIMTLQSRVSFEFFVNGSAKTVEFTQNGLAAFTASDDSFGGLNVNQSNGNMVFGVDTAGTEGAVSIGYDADTEATVFYLDADMDTGGDPSGAEGGMYYNNSTNKFRCYQNTGWTDCITTDTGVTTVGAFSGSSQTNGANITGSTITFGPADGTNPGMVTTGSQTFAGDKTFSGNVVIQGTTGLTFNTGAGGDITFANSEKIDNDTNGQINLSADSGAVTLLLTGTAANINNSAGNLSLNSVGTIELLDNTNLTGNLDVSGTLAVGTSDAFQVSTAGVVTLAGGQATDVISKVTGGVATAITIQPGLSTAASTTGGALNLKGGQESGNDGAGGSVVIQGGNATGTGSSRFGGGVSLDGGTGSFNGAVNIATNVNGAVNIGSTSSTSTITIGQSTASNVINIGSGAVSSGNSQTINIGIGPTGTGAGNVNIGSGNAASNTSIYGGTGFLSLYTGNTNSASTASGNITLLTGDASGTTSSSGSIYLNVGTATSTQGSINIGTTRASAINLGGNQVGQTIAIGPTGINANTATVNIADATLGAQTVSIGSVFGASTTTIQAGTGNLNLVTNSATAKIIAKSSTNSTTAFQVQNASSVALLNVDTTNQRIGINTAAPSTTFQVNQNNLTPGTVTNSAASANVTGSSTTFTTTFSVGDTFTITSSGNTCIVLSITSDTALTCNANLAGSSSGSAYSFTQRARLTVDSNGRTYTNGTLSVTNPGSAGSFTLLNNSSTGNFQISANIAGRAGISRDADDSNGNSMNASKYNSGTGGTVTQLCAYISGVDGSNPHIKFAIYDDSSNSPNNRVSGASPTSITATAGVYNCASIGGSVTLTPNTNYWFVLITEGNSQFGREVGSGNSAYLIPQVYASAPPAAFAETATGNDNIEIYAPYDTITGQSLAASGINVTNNNELHVRPKFDSTDTLTVERADGSGSVLTVDTSYGVAYVTGGFGLNTNGNTDPSVRSIEIANGLGRTAMIYSSAASNTAPLLTLQLGATPGAGEDLINLQDSGGNTLSRFDNTGALILGRSGAGSQVGTLTFNNTTNANTASIQSGVTGTSYSLTLPTALPGSTQCLQSSNTGTLSFTACGGGSGVTTVGAFSGSSQTNGANITGSTITFGPADGTNPGMVSTASQTFAGDKTFSGNVTIQGTTGLTFNTGAGGDITFANSEKIDNDTNGTINLQANTGAMTLMLTGTAANITNSAGTLTLNSFNNTLTVDATDTTFTTGFTTVTLGSGASINSAGNITLDATSTVIIPSADTFQSDDVTSTGALSLVTASNNNINLNPNGSGDVVINQGAGSNLQVTASAATTVDQLVVSNSGQASTTNGVDGVQITFGASNASGSILHATPSYAGGAANGLTYNVFEVDAFSPTNAAGTDNVNGILFGAMTDPGASINSVAINVGSGWDSVLSVGGTPIINSTGVIQSAGISGSYTGITGVGTLTSGTLGAGFTAVGATVGGTGQTSYAVGDLLYANSTTTLAKLADVATGSCLISGGVGVAPAWGACGGTSTYSISRTSGFPVNNSNLSGAAVTTISINPQNVGDLVVLNVLVNNSTKTVSGVSTAGSAITGWHSVTTLTDGTNNWREEVWVGKAAATGSATTTVTYSGGTPTANAEIVADSFTAGQGANTVWSTTPTGSTTNAGSSTNMTLPQLLASGNGQAYWGYAAGQNTGTGGSTGGFTFTVTPTWASVVALNTSLTAGTNYQPVATQSPAGFSEVAGIIMGASAAGTSFINNNTVTQSGNFNVQAATSGSVAGVLQANASGSADILDLLNGAGTTVVSFTNTGGLTLGENLTIQGTTGITFNTGAGGDITFANSEKIDNDTNGQINLQANSGAMTLMLTGTAANITNSAGTLTLNSFNNTLTVDATDTTFTTGFTTVTLGSGASINSAGNITLDATSTVIIPSADTFQSDDVTSTGALSLVTASNNNINLNPNGSGDVVINQGAGSNVQITASAATTVDQLVVSNSGQASTTNGVDGAQITFGSSNASGDALHFTPSYAGGATDALTYNVMEVDAFSPTNAAGTDTVNGLKIGALTDPGATITSTAINIGAGWDTGIDLNNSVIVNIGNANTDFNANGGLTLAENLTVRGTTGLTFNTGAGGDITFANSEKIDNDTNGQINLQADSGAVTLMLTGTAANITNSAGTLTLNSFNNTLTVDATDTTFTTGFTTVTLGSGASINSAGNITLDATSTVIIPSADTLQSDDVTSTGALTLTSANTNNIAVNPGTTGDVVFTHGNDSQHAINTTTSTDLTLNLVDINNTNSSAASTGTLNLLAVRNLNEAGSATGTADSLIYATNLDANETVTNGMLVEQATAGGTLTNGIQILQSAGTLGTGIKLSGTFSTAGIDAGNSTFINIGNANTDFNSNGGLTLAENLTVQGTTGLTFNTGAGGDITFANSEKIDNDTNGTINLQANSGAITLLLTGTAATVSNSAGDLTLDSFSGRLNVATGDFLKTSVAGVSGAAAGDIWYDSTAGKYKINEAGTTKTLCNLTDLACGAGGGGVTTVGAFSGSSQTNGANITGSTITFGPADGTNPGMVSTGSQTFAGAKTFTGQIIQNSDNAAALNLMDSTNTYSNLLFDSSTNHLKVYDHALPRTAYVDIYYSGSTAVIAASTGVTQIGNGTGDVNVSLTNNAERFNFSHTGTNATSSDIDFLVQRNLTGGANNLQGAVFKVEDLSTFSGGSSAPDVLSINQNNTSATGNLIVARLGGGSNDKFKVNTAGTVTIAAGQSYTGVGALTVASGAATALTLTGNAASTLQTTSGGLSVLSAGALTLTGAAASTWSTSSGTLSITSASTLTLTSGSNSNLNFSPGGNGDALFNLDDDTSIITTGSLTNSGQLEDINLTLVNDADADTLSALNIDVISANTGDADIVYGLNIGNLGSADATVSETALRIGTGWDEAIRANGIVTIGAQADASSGTTLTLTNSAAGTYGAETTRDGAYSSVVFNGKVYVSTKENDLSSVYRYDGGTTWTKVSDTTAGKIITGDAAAIDYSILTVYNGKLYAATVNNLGATTCTTSANCGAVYSYDGSTWTMVNSARGTFGAQTLVFGATDIQACNGRLYVASIGTAATNTSMIYRYDGGTTFTTMTVTPGKLMAETTAQIDGYSMVCYGGELVVGTLTGSGTSTARVAKLVGGETQTAQNTTWVQLNNNTSGTGGTFAGNTAIDDVDAMTVFAGQLFVATGEPNLASIYVYKLGLDRQGTPAAGLDFQLVTSTPGRIDSANDATDIDHIPILRQYNGRLYAGSDTSAAGNLGGLYEFNPTTMAAAGSWTRVNSARGTFGSETNIDKVDSIVELNGTLYIGTEDSASNTSGVYTWSKTASNSFALRFDSGNSNYGSLSFVGGIQAGDNNGHMGSFLFSNPVMLGGAAFDYAEDYPTLDSSLEPGEPVSVDPAYPEHVRRARPGDAILGVVSENPGLRLSSTAAPANGAKWIPIALVGRVPVKVMNVEGEEPIKAGDQLVLSDMPGVLKKAGAYGQVVGSALEGYDGTDIHKIMLYVNPSSFISDEWLAGIDTKVNGSSPMALDLNITGGLSVGGVAKFHGNAFFYKFVTFVEKTVFKNDITLAGHVGTIGDALSVSLAPAAGLTQAPTDNTGAVLAAATVDGNDVSGQFTLNFGDDSTTGEVLTLKFAKPYAKAPNVLLTPANDKAGQVQYYVKSTKDGFTLYILGAQAAGTSLQFNYWASEAAVSSND